MLVVKSHIQKLVRDQGKRMSKNAWTALETKIRTVLEIAGKKCGSKKTITETEILS